MRCFPAMILTVAALAAPPHYVDIASAAGLTVLNSYGGVERKEYILETTGNGVAIFDSDGDGWNDVFVANGTKLGGGRDPLPQLYRNDGKGRFRDVAAEAGLTQGGWAQGVCAGDYDNDGRTDLFVTYYGHNRLYRNENGERFTDVTGRAGLPVSGTRWGAGCAFLDYNRDGRLDLFVSNYVDLDLKNTPKPGSNPFCKWKGLAVMCGPRGLPPARNAIYRGGADGRFTDVSREAGILQPGSRYGLGVAAADFDGDGWTDIYVACDMTPSLFYRNRRDGTFEERGVAAGVAFNFDGRLQAGMGVAVADYDGNGFLDIAKTNFSGDLPSLYSNEDGRFFSDLSQPAGLGANQLLGWGVAFLDADEDGRPDLVLANGHVYPEVDGAGIGESYRQKTLLYRNLGDGRFRDITAEAGPAFAEARPARGLATGDLDGDGHPEIVIVNMNERPSLLKNTRPAGSALVVQVRGTRSNRSGIGTRVAVQTGAGTQLQEVTSGGSYYSHNDFSLHFGLGGAPRAVVLRIRWPSGLTQEWEDVLANSKVVATEGKSDFTRTPLAGR